jgi:hypothetical protein
VETGFRTNTIFKWSMLFQAICFDQERRTLYLRKVHKGMKSDKQWQIKEEVLSCRTLGGSPGKSSPMSNNTGGNTRVPEDDLKKSCPEVWRDIDFSPSESPHSKQASKLPHNSSPSCCSSLIVPNSDLRHLHATFTQSSPFSGLPNRHGPSP